VIAPRIRPAAPGRHVRAAVVHRAIRLGMVTLSATLLPALWLATWLGRPGAGEEVAVLLVWVLAWVALGTWLLLFRCPQCARPFHRGRGMLSAFTTNCVHCGISLRPANQRR
jgi:hypothetical protein